MWGRLQQHSCTNDDNDVLISSPTVLAMCVTLASSNAVECQSICPLAYQPLCATNENGIMQTFQNECSRMQENCQRKTSKCGLISTL